MESFRESILKKNYMMFFVLAMIFIVVGIILIAVRRISTIYGDASIEFIYTLSYLSTLFLQLGMVLFCFSAFWGAVGDRSLSEPVRRGMVFTSSITIIALALIMIFGSFMII